jgi:hypothetical protein
MAVVIRTKNGTAGVPSSLSVGELAVNTTAGTLFVGATNGSVTQLNDPTSTTVDAGAVATPHLYWDQPTQKWVATSDINVTGGIATLVNGTINGTTIGASSASTGAFTNVVATTIGEASQGSGKFTTLEATGAAILVTGTINGTTIGASTASTGKFTTLEATTGIVNSTIGATNPSTGVFTTLTATSGITDSAIGATNPSTGAFTTLTTSSTIIASGIIKGVWSNTGTANADSQFQVVAALPATPDADTIYFVVP